MNLRQRDLVLISYPFTNLQEAKVRPAMIVSNDIFNQNCDNLLMVPLTSVLREEAYSIPIVQSDLENGKLVKPGKIRIDKLFSVERKLVRMKIGSLSTIYFHKVRKEIVNTL